MSEPVVISEPFARETDASRVDCGGVAVERRDRSVEQARFAKRARQMTAGSVDVLMIDRGNRAGTDEAIKRAREGAVGLAEEGPVEPIAFHLRRGRRDVHQSPSKTGLRLAAKASKARRKAWVVMQMVCACASDSMSSSSPIAHSWLSIVLVIPCAKYGPSASMRASPRASRSRSALGCTAL